MTKPSRGTRHVPHAAHALRRAPVHQWVLEVGGRKAEAAAIAVTRLARPAMLLFLAAALAAALGCGTAQERQERRSEFFTSGSREADQRASQRMARAEQLEGSAAGAGEKGKQDGPLQAEEKRTLYDRLGGAAGLARIVDDFTTRALQDPRVNWQREGIKRGGFSLRRDDTVTWNTTPGNVAQLKKHMAQFLALATGGPARYEGKDMKAAHAGLRITNAEFDASVGDLKATLDRLKVPNQEQKELLAIIESTRPQIVTER